MVNLPHPPAVRRKKPPVVPAVPTALTDVLGPDELRYYADNILHLGTYADEQLNPKQANADLSTLPQRYDTHDQYRLRRVQRAMVLGLAVEYALRFLEQPDMPEPTKMVADELLEVVDKYIDVMRANKPGKRAGTQRYDAWWLLQLSTLVTVGQGVKPDAAVAALAAAVATKHTDDADDLAADEYFARVAAAEQAADIGF